MANYATIEERLVSLEVRIQDNLDSINLINNKIDDLLTLKNKGAGAFWLISALFGTGLLGAMTWIIDLVRGH